jgi:conjugative relaxase-like TrwC/TraI family protein
MQKRLKPGSVGCVLSVAKLTPGQESYYERSVAAGLDDYYAGRGESPGMWVGRGAAALGLEGVVAEGQLGLLVRGSHPAGGEQLRRHYRPRTITIERIDPHAGTRRTEQKKLAPVAGFDLVFSPPKSVSLLHALGDDDARRAVNEAHTAAWQAALAYLEDEACITRRGKNGVLREHGGGFVAAAYQHRTSRALDPHLHTHVIVANMTVTPDDGEWRALDGEAILKTYRLAAGYLYQSHLRSELSRTLGVEWETPMKGMADLGGMPAGVVAEFSQRRSQVVEELQRRDASGYYAAQQAAVDTRERKEHADLGRLRETWRARAEEHGLGCKELARLTGRSRGRGPTTVELRGIAREMLGPTGLTEQRATFTEPELVMAWAEAHEQGAPADRIRQVCSRFVDHPEVETVSGETAPGRPARYSTLELTNVERKALALVDAGRDAGTATASDEAIDYALQGVGDLSSEQQALLRSVAASSDRVVCVVGLAGAGKTTATRAVRKAFEASGVQVVGAAPSGVAAQQLQDETGVASTTLHRLLASGTETNTSLPAGCLLVIDEAGMADTRVLARVLERADRVGAKVLLVGDPHQLPAVGAGGLFAAIVERTDAIELTENRRQHDLAEREALAAIRDGLGRDYLAYAEANERLIVSGSDATAQTRLVSDWWHEARADLPGTIMIALRRNDVAELNALARALMDSHGLLGQERLHTRNGEFAAGDRVVCLHNSDRLGVRNGTRATVQSVDEKRKTIVLSTDRGDTVEIGGAYLNAGHVHHAYALTGHRAQGITVDRAFVLATDGGRIQEWGYVALSRARHQTRIYITDEEREPESHFHELDDRPSTTRIADALERSATENLATNQQPPRRRCASRAHIEHHEPDAASAAQKRRIDRAQLALEAGAKVSPARTRGRGVREGIEL